jgi:orotate phosphoribosyltransferase
MNEPAPTKLRELLAIVYGNVQGVFYRRFIQVKAQELGAVALAAAASMESGKPFVLVRNQKKDYGTAKQVEGILNPGDRVLIIEDIATTGGQMLESVTALRNAGAVVDRVIVVIDRLEGARENIEGEGLTFNALFTTKDLGI